MRELPRLLLRVASLGILAGGVLLIAHPALAKAQFDKLTILDTATGRELEVAEPAVLGFFAFTDFDGGTRQAPSVNGSAYEVTRWQLDHTNLETLIPVDRLVYYHTSEANTLARGWVYYDGLINGSSEYDGKWFPSTRDADAWMESILFEGSSQAASSAGAVPILSFAAVGLAGFILGLGTMWFVRLRPIPSSELRKG